MKSACKERKQHPAFSNPTVVSERLKLVSQQPWLLASRLRDPI
jgi:hypothetical protein